MCGSSEVTIPFEDTMLLLKLDIAKAYDSVRWDYLLDLIQKRGFPSTWRN